jgi:hypothetical protein
MAHVLARWIAQRCITCELVWNVYVYIHMNLPRALRNSTACCAFLVLAESAFGHLSDISTSPVPAEQSVSLLNRVSGYFTTPVPAASLPLFAPAQDGLEPASIEA